MMRLARGIAALAAALAGMLAGSAGAEPPGIDCLIQPRTVARVSSSVPGVLESIEVDRGDMVEPGQVLARLESSVEQAAVAMAEERARAKASLRSSEARLELERSDLGRTRVLRERKVASDAESQNAETRTRVAEMELLAAQEEQRLAELDLARTRAVLARRSIESPIRGVVVRVTGSPGEYFEEQPILELAELDPLYIEVFVPLAQFGRIELGSTARVRPEAAVGGQFEARVVVVDRVVDAASGTFGVRLEVSNPDYAIPAGLRCSVEFPGLPGPLALQRDAEEVPRELPRGPAPH